MTQHPKIYVAGHRDMVGGIQAKQHALLKANG
jgi:hypothetical protein